MNLWTSLILLLLLLLLVHVGAVAVTASDKSDTLPLEEPQHRDLQFTKLGEVLERVPTLKVLVAALKKTELFDLFLGDESQTLFGPPDSAFSDFGVTVEIVEALENESDIELLKQLLLYHVIPGAKTTDDFEEGAVMMNAAGRPLNVRFQDDLVYIGPFQGAQVSLPNQLAANGVLHMIGAVMNPTIPGDLPFTIGDIGRLGTLLSAVQGAGLVPTLEGEGPFTIFAPTNAAFAALGDSFNDIVADTDILTSILLHHVVPGSFFTQDLKGTRRKKAKKLTTAGGSKLRVKTRKNGNFKVGTAKLKTPNLDATNGVIHLIDTVLVPPADEEEDGRN